MTIHNAHDYRFQPNLAKVIKERKEVKDNIAGWLLAWMPEGSDRYNFEFIAQSSAAGSDTQHLDRDVAGFFHEVSAEEAANRELESLLSGKELKFGMKVVDGYVRPIYTLTKKLDPVEFKARTGWGEEPKFGCTIYIESPEPSCDQPVERTTAVEEMYLKADRLEEQAEKYKKDAKKWRGLADKLTQIKAHSENSLNWSPCQAPSVNVGSLAEELLWELATYC